MRRGLRGQSPASIAHHLRGIAFPASKDELIEHAEDNNAPDEVLDVIEDLPNDEYHSMPELMQGVGQIA